MSVNLKTPPTDNTIAKGTYFVMSNKLFYVRDCLVDSEYYLVENCSTLDSTWFSKAKLHAKIKEVITLA